MLLIKGQCQEFDEPGCNTLLEDIILAALESILPLELQYAVTLSFLKG